MRFSEFLRTAVLLCAASATALAAVTVISAAQNSDDAVAFVGVGLWLVASIVGIRFEPRAAEGISLLLRDARYQTTLPELRPGLTLIARLWLLPLLTVVAGVVGVFLPQATSVATAFYLFAALAWRRQHHAVEGIELRDAARFYVDRTSPFGSIRLVRTPGFGGANLRSAAS